MPLKISRRKVAVILGAVLAFLITFYAGYALGNWRTFSWMRRVLEGEVQGTLKLEVDMLHLMRKGEVERVKEIMELRVQSAVGSLPQGRSWEEIPPAEQRSLVAAKRYFSAYAPRQLSDELLEILEWIPDESEDQ